MNTVAYSAGAVCCPDEASARRHGRTEQATWWKPGGFTRGPAQQSRVADYRTTIVTLPERRWTR